jgi:hypothetical protein
MDMAEAILRAKDFLYKANYSIYKLKSACFDEDKEKWHVKFGIYEQTVDVVLDNKTGRAISFEVIE